MSGILGTHDLTGGVIQTIYTCDTDQFTVANVSICNRHNYDIKISMALTDTANTFDSESMYIEYETILKPKAVLERSAISIPTTKHITVMSTHNNVSAVAWGIRAGDTITVDAIPDAVDVTGPVWSTGSVIELPFNAPGTINLLATDPSYVEYSLVSGSLPAGVTLYSDGRISGQTNAAGAYPLTLAATDQSGNATNLVTQLNIGAVATQGLSLYFDTTNPASWTSGSDPVDLVTGTKTATLVNVSNVHATRDGITCLEFNDTGNMQVAHNMKVPRTYEIWVYHDQSDPAAINWESYFDDNSTESVLFGKQGNSNIVSVYTSSGGASVVSGQVWQQFVYTIDNTTQNYSGRVFKNGQQVATYSDLNRSLVLGNSTLYIGGDSGQGESMDGGVAIARCYDRALTNDEILQNYGIDKVKFNL